MTVTTPVSTGGPDGPQLDAFQTLAAQRDEAAGHLAACRATLRAWAGGDLPLSVVALLQTGELPAQVTDAAWAQQEAARRLARLHQELEDRQAKREQWTSDLTTIQAQRAAHDRDAARVKALAALGPSANRLTTVQAQLAQALTRQAAQQGRGLATLWRAVSGQAGALQRAVDQARADEASALLAYESCARQQGVRPVPDPADLPGQVAREHARLNERKQDLARRQHAAQTALWALGDQDEGTRAAIRTVRQQAAASWSAAQQVYALPTWDRWVDLWARRADAQPLWERHADATRCVQDATRALDAHLATFPADLRDPAEVTRQLGALREAAAAREHAAREQAARQSGRAALVITLQARADTLERTRRHEERVRLEEARREAAQREADRREAQRHQEQEQLARTRENQLALVDVLGGRLTHLRRAAQHAEIAAQERSDQPAPGAVLCAAGHPDAATRHAPETPDRRTASPALPPTPVSHVTRLSDAAQTSRVSGPFLAESDVAVARDLLVRHAAVAAQAAMCLEALEDWAGPGVPGEDALRLAERVSRTPPAGSDDLVALQPPADVPVTAGHWVHLCAAADRGADLRRRWLEAHATLAALEGQMALLWAGWPAGTRHVAALRQVTEAARPAPATPTARATTRPHRRPELDVPAPGVAAPPRPPQLSPRSARREPNPAPHPVSPGAAAHVGSAGPWTTPQLTPQQVPVARTLLDRFDAIGEEERRLLEALADWAGPGLNGLRLAQLVSSPLPAEITQALDAWARTREAPAVTVSPERAQIAAAVQAEKDRSAAVLGPLRLLQPYAAAVIQAEHALAGTRPTAMTRAQRRLLDARDAYAAQAATQGFTPAPSPRRIATLIEDELAAFNRRLQPLDAQWKALVDRPTAPPAPPERPGTWKRAWAAVSAQYGLPPHPDTWERSVWPRRAEGERLWTELLAVRHQVQSAQEDLTVLCATWPARARTVDTLRRVTGRAGTQAGQSPTRPLSPGPDTARTAPVSPAQPAPTAPLPARLPAPRAPAQATPVPSAPVDRPSSPSAPITDVSGPGVPLPVVPHLVVPMLSLPVPNVPVPNVPVQHVPGSQVPGPNMAAQTVTVQTMAAPIPVRRPAVMPPVPPAARQVTPPTPAPTLPSSAASVPVPPSPVPPPSTPPLPPTITPPRPPTPPVPHAATRPAPLLPPVRGVPLPSVPVTRPSTPEPGEPPPEPATGRLTRRQRAEREAVRISDRYDWERGFHLIADALDRDRWGQLRESIEREIERGMTPDEFELLLQLRAYWHDQTHYQSPYTARYDSLPWSLGITLIRRCAGVPCLDDMILLLERLYEYAQVACSPRSLPAFSQRLGAILDRADPDVDLDYWLSTREDR